MTDNEQVQEHLIACYKEVFATPAGRTVLADLRDQTTLGYSAIPLGQPIDRNWLIYFEAQKVFYLRIEAKVNADVNVEAQQTAVTTIGDN